jgi:hypothetical protein
MRGFDSLHPLQLAPILDWRRIFRFQLTPQGWGKTFDKNNSERIRTAAAVV